MVSSLAAPQQQVAPLRRRVTLPAWLVLALLPAGVVAGAGGAGWYAHDRWAPLTVTGTVTAVNSDVSAIGLRVDGWPYATPSDGQGMVLVAQVPWTDVHGESFGGSRTPACLAPGSGGQRIEVRLAHRDGPVEWVHCLS